MLKIIECDITRMLNAIQVRPINGSNPINCVKINEIISPGMSKNNAISRPTFNPPRGPVLWLYPAAMPPISGAAKLNPGMR